MINRRQLVQTSASAITGAGLAACGDSSADTPVKRPFVLVHGSWHGAWCYERLLPLLSGKGHPVVARDLPGHGINAMFPTSYAVQPRTAAFATEVSPVASITLDDYAKQIVGIVEGLLAAGLPAPVLVGHSMGGIAIQTAAERLGPSKLHHLAYIAAFMPADNTSMLSYILGPTQTDSKVAPLFRANPNDVGALRLDFDANDATYNAALTAAFYGDVDAATVRAALNLLAPDDPVAPVATPVRVTAASWGGVPRTYFRTAQDFAVRPAGQDLMISQADAFTPNNKTRVVRMDSSHSPFFSRPGEMAQQLLMLT